MKESIKISKKTNDKNPTKQAIRARMNLILLKTL